MDIIALQELDLLNDDDGILPAFEQWGYQVVRTTSKQRKDCCAIAFDRSKFTLEKHEIIQFDDLATLENIDGNFYCIDNNTEFANSFKYPFDTIDPIKALTATL